MSVVGRSRGRGGNGPFNLRPEVDPVQRLRVQCDDDGRDAHENAADRGRECDARPSERRARTPRGHAARTRTHKSALRS